MIKTILWKADQFMPRWLARLPYSMAELESQTKVQELFSLSTLWIRNSVCLGSFVFGVSDLDLTLLTDSEIDHARLKLFLKEQKKKWPFLGELNLYNRQHLEIISHFINHYEKERDPILSELIPDNSNKFKGVDKIIFLLRLLQSDKQLVTSSEIRQKKWKQHLEQLGIHDRGLFNEEKLQWILEQHFLDSPQLIEALRNFVQLKKNHDFKFFETELHPYFKVLYPHQDYWSDEVHNPIFIGQLSSLEKLILKRQIDWELWGLYTQRYWLTLENMKTHLERLMKLYFLIASGDEFAKAKKVLGILGI